MSGRSLAAIDIWHARTHRTTGDRAFTLYLLLMLTLVAVIPVGRAIWLSAASPVGLALFADSAAPKVTSFIVAMLWAGALLLGRDRGPAVLSPFLTYALASSDLPRSRSFRRPLVRSGACVTAVCTIAAALISTSLASNGMASPVNSAIFTGVGALVGVIATVAWLAGQVFRRMAIAGALALVGLGVLILAAPALAVYTPWGWIGLAYPRNNFSPGLLALTALAALALALLAAVPTLMNRLDSCELATQAARWSSATAHAAGMDFSAASATYQATPYFARRTRAVFARGPLPYTFLVRDVIGATRTPGRLIVGVFALIAAGVLLAFAISPASPGWVLGAAAGVVAFAGLGPLTDGIRHAASVAAGLPLYGISDEHLLASHALFPLAVAAIVLPTAAILCSVIVGTSAVAAGVSALLLALLALVARISNALKGPLPLGLLMPMSTPAGDPMAAVRMVWALDAILFAAFAGAAAMLAALGSPLLLGVVTAALSGIAIKRWRDRG